jgi:serine/threonine-protein kinase
MSLPESPLRDPLEGELAQPPPSDLSEYTWEDSETELYEPGRGEKDSSASTGKPLAAPRAASVDARQFVDALVQNRLVSDSEVRTVSRQAGPEGEPSNVDRLAAELIRLGKITKYQAAAVRQGKTKGLLIGNYVVLDKIGSGGMGLVFKARHRQLQRMVALKLLPPSISRDRAAVVRFRREVAAVANLIHPNIVSALDAGETNGLLFLVMELVDGKDLAKVVREKGPLSVKQAVDCIIQAARGLEAAHDRGIVHRDIKPANLLLDRSGTVKVLDLGLARVVQGQGPLTAESSELNLTVSGSFVGTVDYMSPEQASIPGWPTAVPTSTRWVAPCITC